MLEMGWRQISPRKTELLNLFSIFSVEEIVGTCLNIQLMPTARDASSLSSHQSIKHLVPSSPAQGTDAAFVLAHLQAVWQWPATYKSSAEGNYGVHLPFSPS